MSDITAKIEEYYATLRNRAESRAERMLDRALQDPDFSKINREFQEARIAFFRAEAEGKQELSSCKERFETLKAKRRGALSKLNITEDDLKPHYHCTSCHDTGFLENGEACSCYRALARKFKMEEIGISSVPYRSFQEADPSLTPYIPFVYYQKKYCDVFPKVPLSTVFSGGTGTGKTFLASCIANSLEKKGDSVFFLSAFALNRFFINCFEAQSYHSISLLSECDLLIIDDLGAEPIYKKITLEYLKLVLDERFAHKKPTVITTNLDRDKILERYGERIYSRIFNEESLDDNNTFIGRDVRVDKR